MTLPTPPVPPPQAPAPPDAGEPAAAAAAGAELLGHLAATVQQVHAAVARRGLDRLLPRPLGAARHAATTGIYGLVRGGIAVVGTAAAVTLGAVERTRTATPWTGTPRGRHVAGLVNGAVGDHLQRRHPRLASPMRLRAGGVDVEPERAELARRYPDAAPTVVVFVHGVIGTEAWWIPPLPPGQADGDPRDFGSRLTRDLGCSCVFVGYNSGLPVAGNGAALAELLDELVAGWPVPVERLALVGHSMGGLVARSALHQAHAQGRDWSRRVSDVVCLGTPHEGAPLERVARRTVVLLDRDEATAPIGALLAARSAGIKDLAGDHPAVGPDAYRPPAAVRHANLAGTLAWVPAALTDRVGDLLVPTASALSATWPTRTATVAGPGHRGLLTHDAVYARLAAWLRAGAVEDAQGAGD